MTSFFDEILPSNNLLEITKYKMKRQSSLSVKSLSGNFEPIKVLISNVESSDEIPESLSVKSNKESVILSLSKLTKLVDRILYINSHSIDDAKNAPKLRKRKRKMVK